MINKIQTAIKKFDLCLENKTVFTEAASGNFVVTPIIAALAGARVVAITRDSKYATADTVKKETLALAEKAKVENRISIVTNLKNVKFGQFNIVTNTGFVRPINQSFISWLSDTCVIPLMWEPWEFRAADIDIEACSEKGIKVYGTNEMDPRLQTFTYIGYIVLHFLLQSKRSPFFANIVLLGSNKIADHIAIILKENHYPLKRVFQYDTPIDLSRHDVVVIAEHHNNHLLIGDNGFIRANQFEDSTLAIHICGNVDFTDVKCMTIPDIPAKFGHMSFTADFIDSQAVIDLHAAGLKVAEGMVRANERQLSASDYKAYMEENYPALAFKDARFW